MLIRNRLLSGLVMLLLYVLPLFAQAGLEEYQRQDSARFRVLYAPQDAGVVHDLWRTIRERVPMVEQRLGLALADTVTIVVAPTEQEWRRLTRGAPLWANGLAYSQAGVAIVKSPRFGLPYGPLPVTAVHEYVHLLLHAGAENAEFPRWLDEGLAQLLAGQLDYMDDVALGRAVVSGRLHNLWRLEGMSSMSAPEAQQGYAEGLVAVQLLEQRFGMAGISNLVHELRKGRPFDEAFSSVFSMTPANFESQYLAYVQDRYRLTFFTDTELWVSAAFVVLVLGGGIAMWVRRRRIIARWKEEDHPETISAAGETPQPPYTINYTIVRKRKEGEEEENDER